MYVLHYGLIMITLHNNSYAKRSEQGIVAIFLLVLLLSALSTGAYFATKYLAHPEKSTATTEETYSWNAPNGQRYPEVTFQLPGTWLPGEAQQPKYLNSLMSNLKEEPTLSSSESKLRLVDWLKTRQLTGGDSFWQFDTKNSGYGDNQLIYVSWPVSVDNLVSSRDILSFDPGYKVYEVRSDLTISGVTASAFVVQKIATKQSLRFDYLRFSTKPDTTELADLTVSHIKWN